MMRSFNITCIHLNKTNNLDYQNRIFPMTKKAVILFSGGLDSSTCLAIAQNEGYECTALSFDYGQRHNSELKQAKQIAQTLGVKHEIVNLGISNFGGSALTDHSIDVPEYTGKDEIPITYVPARNTIFLSIALGLAEVTHSDKIFIGISSIDYSGYPDCRPEYIKAFQSMANLATKTGIDGQTIQIETPLALLSKKETIELGIRLGVDYSLTVSCYSANEHGEACGKCDSCVLRKKGFSDANITDPTRYVEEHLSCL